MIHQVCSYTYINKLFINAFWSRNPRALFQKVVGGDYIWEVVLPNEDLIWFTQSISPKADVINGLQLMHKALVNDSLTIYKAINFTIKGIEMWYKYIFPQWICYSYEVTKMYLTLLQMSVCSTALYFKLQVSSVLDRYSRMVVEKSVDYLKNVTSVKFI